MIMVNKECYHDIDYFMVINHEKANIMESIVKIHKAYAK